MKQQRILTYSQRFVGIDSYNINFDNVTKQLNDSGWNIKQIISTSFEHQITPNQRSYPVIVITILIEKVTEEKL